MGSILEMLLAETLAVQECLLINNYTPHTNPCNMATRRRLLPPMAITPSLTIARADTTMDLRNSSPTSQAGTHRGDGGVIYPETRQTC